MSCMVLPIPDYNCIAMSPPAATLYNNLYNIVPNNEFLHGFSPESRFDVENKLRKGFSEISLSTNIIRCEEKPKQKRVTFADAVGQELVQIRHLTAGRDTPPNIDPAIISSLLSGCDEKPDNLTLKFDFSQPISDYSRFRDNLEQYKVALESISLNQNRLVGTVKVKNLAFTKRVFLRLTYNNWASFEDIDAYYVNNGVISATGARIASSLDTFCFEYDIDTGKLSHFPIIFAIGFQCNGAEYWDNHESKNYKILVHNFCPETRFYQRKPDFISSKPNWSEFAIWNLVENDFTPYW